MSDAILSDRQKEIADGRKKIWIPLFLLSIFILASLITPKKPENSSANEPTEHLSHPHTEIEDSDPLPKYDVDAYCTHGDQTFESNRMRTSYCIELQQGAYNELKAMWYKVPAVVKKHCFSLMEQHQKGVIQNVDYHTYYVLKGCIDNFLQMQQMHELAEPHSFTP